MRGGKGGEGTYSLTEFPLLPVFSDERLFTDYFVPTRAYSHPA